MGGGGGGGGISIGALAELTAKAKESLREGSEEPKRNVFISFAYEDMDDVTMLRGQAKNEMSELEFNDWSLQEPFDTPRAAEVRAGIRDRILQSSVTLVYVSQASAASKWVDWEIRESVRLGKRVIAMHKGDTPPAILPAALTDHDIRPIPWTHQGLMDAIHNRG